MPLRGSQKSVSLLLLLHLLLLLVGVTASITRPTAEVTSQPQTWPSDAMQSMGVTEVEVVTTAQVRAPWPLTTVIQTLSTIDHSQGHKNWVKLGHPYPYPSVLSDTPLHQALSTRISPRDFTTAQFNFNQIVLLLHNLSTRIALPWPSIIDTSFNHSEIFDISPLDLALVPEGYPEFSETMVHLNEEEIVIICASQPQEGVPEWKFVKLCPEQKTIFLVFLRDVAEQGAKLAVPRERLKRARKVDLKALEDGLYSCVSKNGATCAPMSTETGTAKWGGFLSGLYSQKSSTSMQATSTSIPLSALSAGESQSMRSALHIGSPPDSGTLFMKATSTSHFPTTLATKPPVWKHPKPTKPQKPPKTWIKGSQRLPPRQNSVVLLADPGKESVEADTTGAPL